MMDAPGPRDDIEYFRHRALEEQIAAGNASSAQARRSHDELAMMYRFKVTMLSKGPDSWTDTLDISDTNKAVDANLGEPVTTLPS